MKKAKYLIMMGIISAAMMAGCGSSGNETTSAAAETTAAAAETTAQETTAAPESSSEEAISAVDIFTDETSYMITNVNSTNVLEANSGEIADQWYDFGGIECRLAGGQCLFHFYAGRVHGLAHARALFSGHLAHGSQIPGQRAGLAQHRHAHRLERRRRVRRGDFGQGALAQRRQLLCDCHKVRLSSRANKKEPSSVPPGAACGLPGIQGREKALAVPPRLATHPRTHWVAMQRRPLVRAL